MIGAEFTGVLHAAQQGRVNAFERLWADVHPALVRYLRVVAVADADDIACESWVAVVRQLRSFEGDETAWRQLVFSAARMHAEDENQRRVWDAMVEDDEVTAVVAGPLPPSEEPFEEDELEGGPAHGLRMAIEAIRDLPPEQGEVVMLREVALLPAAEVAALLGTDAADVHAVEQQALDQLGLDAELVAWALGVEPRPVEVVDQDTVVRVFRSMVPEQLSPSAGALRRETGESGARVIALRRPTWRARAGAVATLSAAVVGLGAFSAAAYQNVLPAPVQNVMHVVIGAPEPTSKPAGSTRAAAKPPVAKKVPGTATTTTTYTTATTAPTSSAATATSPLATPGSTVTTPMSPAVAKLLCQAWAAERAHGGTEKSATFSSLAQAAGSAGVDGFCQAVGVSVAAPEADPTPTTPPTVATPVPPITPPTTATPPTTVTPPVTPTGPTDGPTTPSPTTTTDTPQPTTTTTTGSDGAGVDSGTGGASTGGASTGGAGSQGALNRSTDSLVGGNGQTRGLSGRG